MSNSLRNSNHKSAVQYYNTTEQLIPVTSLAANPLTLTLGSEVTETGTALDLHSNNVEAEHSGLYRISANVNVLGTAAGDVTFAITLNGIVLPETITTFTTVVGATGVVPLETVRYLRTCCCVDDYNIGVVAYSDGTGTATVTRLSGNVVKLG